LRAGKRTYGKGDGNSQTAQHLADLDRVKGGLTEDTMEGARACSNALLASDENNPLLHPGV
jgi:hypothetical protein